MHLSNADDGTKFSEIQVFIAVGLFGFSID